MNKNCISKISKAKLLAKKREELAKIEARIDYFLNKWGWNLSDLEGEY
jgi:hypothetical protein